MAMLDFSIGVVSGFFLAILFSPILWPYYLAPWLLLSFFSPFVADMLSKPIEKV
jgi:hypothetical protein